MGYEYSLPNWNRPRVVHKHNLHPSKEWGVCDKSQYRDTLWGCLDGRQVLQMYHKESMVIDMNEKLLFTPCNVTRRHFGHYPRELRTSLEW